MKRGYLVVGRDSFWGVPVVAATAKKAKLLAWAGWEWELDCDFIDVRVHWRRDAIVADLPDGIVTDDVDALHRNLIDCLYEG